MGGRRFSFMGMTPKLSFERSTPLSLVSGSRCPPAQVADKPLGKASGISSRSTTWAVINGPRVSFQREFNPPDILSICTAPFCIQTSPIDAYSSSEGISPWTTRPKTGKGMLRDTSRAANVFKEMSNPRNALISSSNFMSLSLEKIRVFFISQFS